MRVRVRGKDTIPIRSLHNMTLLIEIRDRVRVRVTGRVRVRVKDRDK